MPIEIVPQERATELEALWINDGRQMPRTLRNAAESVIKLLNMPNLAREKVIAGYLIEDLIPRYEEFMSGNQDRVILHVADRDPRADPNRPRMILDHLGREDSIDYLRFLKEFSSLYVEDLDPEVQVTSHYEQNVDPIIETPKTLKALLDWPTELFSVETVSVGLFPREDGDQRPINLVKRRYFYELSGITITEIFSLERYPAVDSPESSDQLEVPTR